MVFGRAGTRAWRLGRFAGLGIGRAAGVRGLWGARRRDRPWCRSNRWFARRAFGWRWRGGGRIQRRLFLQPILIGRRLIDNQLSLHAILAKPAELAAHDFEFSRFDWLEPHRDDRPAKRSPADA